MTEIELLAPARDTTIAREAILHGADAVYIGAEDFGARAAATNSVEAIADLCRFAHFYNARVYVTMNTILYEDELSRARDLVCRLYEAGVDALIVQDMAYLTMDIPPIQLHASTQCDIRTPEKARFLADAGFSQLVLPREFSAEEIAQIHSTVDVPLEVFVHGALCVSYSGDCQAGFIATGRSANRGTCPQMCRLPYDLIDGKGKVLLAGKHLLSLRDLNRLDDLGRLLEAGATSFKIEGRLKDIAYVRNVVSAYSRALDTLVEASQGKYRRRSVGHVSRRFTPDVNRSFNRGFTSYFLDPACATRMASMDSPKWIGMPVGTVTSAPDRRGTFTAKLTASLSNGDGLGFTDPLTGQFIGFRLNRVDGNRLYPASAVPVKAGMTLYRNRDKAWDDVIEAKSTTTRTIGLRLELEIADNILTLIAEDRRGVSASVSTEIALSPAKSDQKAYRVAQLERMGGTGYHLDNLDDRVSGDVFIPGPILADLRRRTLETLTANALAAYPRPMRTTMNLSAQALATNAPLTYHDNVANSAARRFYTEHGATVAQEAIEVAPPAPGEEVRVMETRYCIRRELGACLRTPSQSRKLPRDLYLQPTDSRTRYRLNFDCARCRMQVFGTRK